MNPIFTIGHSTMPLSEFISLLKENGITLLIDVRSVPRSRHNPQFNKDSLPAELEKNGIRYEHIAGLGGLRHPVKDSQNLGWRNPSFRGYADYMQTAGFERSLEELIEKGKKDVIAIMCAEKLPWRCHRSLIGDALSIRDIEAVHIMGPGKTESHIRTLFMKVDEGKITYPEG